MVEHFNENVRIEVPETAMWFTASADYKEYENASGLKFLLLKMIQYGQKNGGSITLIDALKMFSIPEDLFLVVLDELEDMAKNEVISIPWDPRNKKFESIKSQKLGNITLSKDGETVLEAKEDKKAGLIPVKNDTFTKRMQYAPAKLIPYMTEELKSTGHATRKPIEETEFRNFVEANKTQFGMSENAEISGRIKCEVEEAFTYPQPIYLRFDIDHGYFEIDERSSGVNIGYIYSRKNHLNLLYSKIPREKFELAETKFQTKWTSEVPEGTIQCVLPGDFRLDRGFVLYNNKVISKLDVAINEKLPAEEEGDLVLIARSYEGYRYWFTKKEVTLKDFPDLVKKENMVVCKTMSKAEISKCVRATFSGLKMNTLANLESMNSITRATQDASFFSERVKEEIENADNDAIKKLLKNLNKLESKIWKDNVNRELEKLMCKRIKAGAELSEISELYKICKDADYRIDGSDLIDTLSSKKNLVEITDWFYDIGLGVERILEQRQLPSEIIGTIVSGREIPSKSDFGKSICLARDAFAVLRKTTGIDNAAKYTFAFDGVGEDDRGTAIKNMKTLDTNMAKLVFTCPSITKVPEYTQMQKSIALFKAATDAYAVKKLPATKGEMVREESTVRFLKALKQKLDDGLRQLGVRKAFSKQLEEIRNKGLLKKSSPEDLAEFVQKCDHICSHDILCDIDKVTRTRWVNAVFELYEAEQ